MSTIIVDAGPMVAYVDAADQHHAWVKDKFRLLAEPVHTCEAALSEACHLLAGVHDGEEKLGEMLKRGLLRIGFDLSAHHIRVFSLMRRYADVPMSLADACLVCMAEDMPHSRVFSTDSDFTIYRMHGRKPVPAILPTQR